MDARTFAKFITLAAVALAVPGVAASQTGYGTSSISFSPSSGSITAGGSMAASYTVGLASGGTWGTNMVLQDSAALSSNGINVTLSNPSGDPPFSGTITITASNSAPSGTYVIEFAATGDDPSASPAAFQLGVTAPNMTSANMTAANSTAAGNRTANSTAQQTAAATSSVPPQTTQGTIQYGSSGSAAGGGTALYLSILAVIALFAVIAAAFRFA